MPTISPPCGPEPAVCAVEDLRDPFRLEPGVAYECSAGRSWTARTVIPVDFCLRWLRETPHGMCRNPLPLRFRAGSQPSAELTIDGRLTLRVRRERRRIRVELARQGPAGPPPGAVARVLEWDPPAEDPLLASLLGIHPLEWFRDAVVHTGMHERVYSARLHGAPIKLIERLRDAWEPLTIETEAEAWTSLGEQLGAARAALGNDEELLSLAQRMYAYSQRMLTRERWPLWAVRRIQDYLGEFEHRRLPVWRKIRDRLHQAAAVALRQLLAGHAARTLRCAVPGDILAHASFSLSERGAAHYQAAIGGNLTGFDLPGLLPASPCVDVELPFRSRHEIRTAADMFADARAGVECAGRVVVAFDDPRDSPLQSTRRAAMLALGGEFSHQNRRWDTAANPVFLHEQSFAAGSCRESFEPLLREYGIPSPEWPAGPFHAKLIIELSGRLFQAWSRAPLPRDPRFGEAFGRVSLRLQQLLRLWLPALWFSDPAHYAPASAAYPLVAYQATPLWQAGPASGFTCDTTLGPAVTQARRGALEALPGVASAIETRLRRHGHEALAKHYARNRVRDIIRHARPGSLYPALLRNEGFLMDELIGIVSRLRELKWTLASASSGAGRLLNQAAGETAHAIRRRLASPFREVAVSHLGPLIIMEATCALNGATLPDLGRAHLVLECGDRVHA